MPKTTIPRFMVLPELFLKGISQKGNTFFYHLEKKRKFEVCPKCATPSSTFYDKRMVKIKDSPMREKTIYMMIQKHRYLCKECNKPFTEPIKGIRKGGKTTERLKRSVLWACDNYSDLKRVQKANRCSSGFVYNALYKQLELERRKKQIPWPKTIGMDEHSFKRNKQYGYREFATIIPSFKHKRLVEVVHGKSRRDLWEGLRHIPGRDNVENVVMDLCAPYRSFVKEFFPNAQITADKFHVLRLLTPAINRHRKAIVGDRRGNPIGKLLLRNGSKLEYYKRKAINRWLKDHPVLEEIYMYKEAMFKLYRCKGYDRALQSFNNLVNLMGYSGVKEIQTLRRTLIRWKVQILNYFKTKLTNARTEAYNNIAKLVQKRAFGYKSFGNYRLRLLNACSY